MLFHIFNSREERRNYGGSAFVEIQFCKLSSGTATDKLVAVDSINNWQDDSLYIDDGRYIRNQLLCTSFNRFYYRKTS